VDLDAVIVAAYLVLTLGVGLYFRRYANRGLDQFFLAGRSVPGWLNGVSYAAAIMNPSAATAYGGLAVVTGVFVCWWYLSRFALAMFVGAVLFAIFWRRLGLFTSMEFYELRYSGTAAALMRFWIAFRSSVVAMGAWTGVTLLATCKVLRPAMGLSKNETLLLVIPVSFLLIYLAGYKGLVLLSFVKMTILLAGSLYLAMRTVALFGGPGGFRESLVMQLGPVGGQMLRSFPPADHPVFPLAAAIAWLIGQTIGYGGDAAPMGGAMEGQRILSTRSAREAVTMYIVAAVAMFTLVLLVSLPCLAAAILWPQLREPHADRELAYGMLMKRLLPSGAMGLMVAATLASVMATVADHLNFGGQVVLNDLYRRWIVRHASERHYLIAGKLAMLLILGIALAVVYNAKLIFDVAVFMLQLSSAELPANWAQWWWWRFNGKARIAASFGGAAIFCLVVLLPRALVSVGVTAARPLAAIPWWWQTFLVMGLTTLLWVAVALLTRPDPAEVLEAFYRRAHPLGSWDPVRRRIRQRVLEGAAA
jgi:Na+/proline symporter